MGCAGDYDAAGVRYESAGRAVVIPWSELRYYAGEAAIVLVGPGRNRIVEIPKSLLRPQQLFDLEAELGMHATCVAA